MFCWLRCVRWEELDGSKWGRREDRRKEEEKVRWKRKIKRESSVKSNTVREPLKKRRNWEERALNRELPSGSSKRGRGSSVDS